MAPCGSSPVVVGRILALTGILATTPAAVGAQASRSIDTLWATGNAAKTGAIVGGLLVGTLGVVLLRDDWLDGGRVVLIGIMDLVGGALLGSSIGAAVPAWRRETKGTIMGTLKPGRRVRVMGGPAASMEGRFNIVINDSLRLLTTDSVLVIPMSSMDSIWVRRNAAGTGTLVGGWILGLTWGAVLMSACQSFADHPCSAGDFAGLFMVGFGTGGAAGALAGALVGSAVGRWERKWPPGGAQFTVGPSLNGGLGLNLRVTRPLP